MTTRYELTSAQREAFDRDGWLRLPGFLSGAEVAELAAVYERFVRREIPVDGRDYCDMSGEYGDRAADDFAIVNVMLPSRYHPPLRGNVYERRAADVAAQLCGDDMALDYDQLVAKRPGKTDAVFHWHQDLAYWPLTTDTRTASFWLAIDESTVLNGCLRFVRGSHREADLREHRPLTGSRDESHTLVAHVDAATDVLDVAELRPGDATVHHERTLHGSGGNESTSWRRGWVLAFRSRATVAEERAMGFTHSHNDDLGVLERVGYRAADRDRQ